MTNQELLDAGYKRWDPSPYEDCVTDMFQKCITGQQPMTKVAGL